MDDALKKRLIKIDEQIEVLSLANARYRTLYNAKDHKLSVLMSENDGKSQAAKEMIAKATDEWRTYMDSLSIAESEFDKQKHILELKNSAFFAELATYKIENEIIKKQL